MRKALVLAWLIGLGILGCGGSSETRVIDTTNAAQEDLTTEEMNKLMGAE